MKEIAIFLYRHNRSNFHGELTWTKGKKREVSEKKVYDFKTRELEQLSQF